jgi:hypothetical protein
VVYTGFRRLKVSYMSCLISSSSIMVLTLWASFAWKSRVVNPDVPWMPVDILVKAYCVDRRMIRWVGILSKNAKQKNKPHARTQRNTHTNTHILYNQTRHTHSHTHVFNETNKQTHTLPTYLGVLPRIAPSLSHCEILLHGDQWVKRFDIRPYVQIAISTTGDHHRIAAS